MTSAGTSLASAGPGPAWEWLKVKDESPLGWEGAGEAWGLPPSTPWRRASLLCGGTSAPGDLSGPHPPAPGTAPLATAADLSPQALPTTNLLRVCVGLRAAGLSQRRAPCGVASGVWLLPLCRRCSTFPALWPGSVLLLK
uniref:Uncharacterized protein n=1 Tax=Rousettus aegyptiacus TaxID=9407 RepID=A0A7J8H0M5_ROUAE|nr:hypothetical protein HJG63_011141 [Rousettus aegyptiacus]